MGRFVNRSEGSSLPGERLSTRCESRRRRARVWNEYLWDAFARVNDTNARKIVLYLAAHEPEERGRDQILSDLGLDMRQLVNEVTRAGSAGFQPARGRSPRMIL